MKIRNGFVSNSSSSSFVCEITGHAYEIYDGVFKDSELAKCKRGHIFERSLMLDFDPDYPSQREMIAQLEEGIDSKKECAALRDLTLDELKERYLEAFKTSEYEADPMQCPICQMQNLSDTMILNYLLKTEGTSKDTVIGKIRRQFDGSYTKFAKWLNQ